MALTYSQIISRAVVYFVIFCHIVGGIFQLFSSQTFYRENPYSDPEFAKVSAVVSICLGSLLLAGVIQESFKCLIVYLGITSPVSFLVTLQLLIALTHVPEKTFFVLVILVIMWTIQYFIYLYYKELLKIDKAKRTCTCNQEPKLNKTVEIMIEKV